MATAKRAATKDAAAKGTTSTAVTKWEEELAKQADVASAMEANAGGGQFFSLKSGILSWQDAPLPGNQMAVIIVDGILENVFYEGEYDPDTPQGPTCFAFGREEKTIEPHELVVEAGNAQADQCHGCPMNEWGTADKGKGKACRNSRRLAMIPAGNFDAAGKFVMFDDADHFASTPIAVLKLPVTSVKGYAGFVKQVAGALRRPPHGIITRVKVVPDPKSQFKVLFEPIMNVPDEYMSIVMQRHEEGKSTIDFPYQPFDAEAAPAPKAKSRAAQRPPVKSKPAAKGGRKY